jgi:hypothetical protein
LYSISGILEHRDEKVDIMKHCRTQWQVEKYTSLDTKWQAETHYKNIISLRAKHTNTEANYTKFHLDRNYTQWLEKEPSKFVLTSNIIFHHLISNSAYALTKHMLLLLPYVVPIS